MWYICDVLCAVLFVRVNCFVVRGSAVSRRYINVCNNDVFSIVNMYVDHLKLYMVCINSQIYDCWSEYYVVSNERDDPTPCSRGPETEGSRVGCLLEPATWPCVGAQEKKYGPHVVIWRAFGV